MKLLNSFKIIAFSVIVLSSVQCSKYDGENEQYTAASIIDGSQVRPISASTATGSITGVYDSRTNTLSGTLAWSGLSGAPTTIDFHGPAKIGTNNRFALFTMVKVPPTATGSMTFESVFTEVQESWLINGQFYVDFHTASKPTGEIRGQILLQ